MKKLLLIVNPNAGKSKIKGSLTDILDIFIKAEYRVETYITQKPGDATAIASERGAEFDRVVCSGGDGTLDETVNGLMQISADRRPEIGYISAGTTNDYGKSLHLPTNMVEAAQVAASDKVTKVDVGCANGSYYCYVYGFGAFTDVSYATPQELKRVLGHQAYIVEGAKELWNLKPYPMRIEANGDVYEGEFICGLVSNSERIGGVPGLWGKDIEITDGVFEVTLLRQPATGYGFGELLGAFLTGNGSSEDMIQFKTNEIHFHSDDPVNWVKDGEFGGEFTDVELTCVPGAISFVTG